MTSWSGVCALLLVICVVCGCTQAGDTAGNETVIAAINLTSDAFEANGTIPSVFTCDGDNISPPLNWTEVPNETASLALVMDDPDAPGGTFTHWLAWNISPARPGLPEAVATEGALDDGIVQGTNGFGDIGYGGPCPPPGLAHHYQFRLLALDEVPSLAPGADRDSFDNAVKGHVVAEGQYTGLYGREG